jgi:hypothetical protein
MFGISDHSTFARALESIAMEKDAEASFFQGFGGLTGWRALRLQS